MINIQTELRPALPTVYGPKDYREFRSTLEEMDRILEVSGIEKRFINRLISAEAEKSSCGVLPGRYKAYRSALRYSIVRALTGYSMREMARTVADSILFQWFTNSAQVDGIRPVAKSTIDRFEKMIPSEELRRLIEDLNGAVADENGAQELLYRESALQMDKVFADTTCVQTNIHFPVDWLLLRDAARTLIKAIILIRKHGLTYRIGTPESFMKEMNKLCIEMTHARKTRGAKRKRKAILRRMKKLMKLIESHAINYHRELKARWEETDWTELQAQNVLDRLDNVLNQLPQAIEQAHERIIGERKVPTNKKILSLYESGTRVIVRGKAGAEVEFGNALYLAEQADGLIIDWNFIEEQPPADSKLVEASLNRIEEAYGKPESYTADRGFDAHAIRDLLEGLNIVNGVCPLSVPLLKKKLEDEDFCLLQKRRAQTEARVGIFKNAYLGKPLRSKGFSNRKTRIEWCVLTHNLWKLAKMAAQEKEKRLAEAA